MKKNAETKVFERYRQLRRERSLLKSMIARLEKLAEEDIIETMNYKRLEEQSGKRHIESGHTPYIALHYKKEFRKQYEEELKECYKRFLAVDKELALIEASIRLLPEHLQQFVKHYAVDGLTWFEIEEIMAISHASVGRWRKQAEKLLNDYMELID